MTIDPTMRGLSPPSRLGLGNGTVREMVINGRTEADLRQATRVGIEAICQLGAESGVRRISAGNYGGKLGQFHFHLRELMA